ncbi:MAG: hypothetical protein KJZ69_03765 [Phycisphaerales bacterium]|nr:hypothetical protein [Phycisphaerales bacterium]
MELKRIMTLALGCSILGGGATLADEPVARPDGTTITPVSQSLGEQVVYPNGCPVVYETFNDTYPPNYGSGWTISDWPTIGCWGPAHKFTVTSDYALCQILVSATHVTGINQYLVRLHADDTGGNEPGTEMGSWEFFNIPQNQAGPTPLLEADATGICLESGQSYWLSIIASGGGSNSWGVLRMSTQPGNERQSSTWKCSFWEARGVINSGAWRVTGNEGCGGGPTLRISGDCPGRVTVAWADATPSRPMGIALANSTGSYTLPGGICAGTQLGLSSSGLQLVYSGNTGANGSGQVSSNAGTGACRKYLQMIVVDGSPCTTSNVVQIP